MLRRLSPIVRKTNTRHISGTEVANIIPGTFTNVLGVAGAVLSSVGGFYFLIENNIKESKKESDSRMEKLEGKLDKIGISVARIEEKISNLLK